MDLLFYSIFFGGFIHQALGQWTLALFLIVILFDLFVGLRNKYFIAFAVLQTVGLVGGYFWATEVGKARDVAGPYAAALLVSVWCVAVVVFHLFWAVRSVRKA